MKKLLVFIDLGTWANHEPIFNKWLDQITAEGIFQPTVLYMSRVPAYNSGNRLYQVVEILTTVLAKQPDAVQLIGAVGMPCSGWTAYDGHESRPVWTDVIFTGAVTDPARLTDKVNYKPASPTYIPPHPYSNIIGDGRWDSNFYGKPRWPVGRIDLSDIWRFQSNFKIPAGQYGAGGYSYPAVNELEATADYFARNLAYRTAGPSRTEAVVTGSLLQQADMNRLKPLAPGYLWSYASSTSKVAGLPLHFLFDGIQCRYWYQYYTPSGSRTTAFWKSTYSSKQYAMVHDGCALRRSLTWSLVSTWGRNVWCPTSADKTVADVFMSSWARYAIPLYATLCGDITLPLPHARIPKIQIPGSAQ